MTKTTAFLLVAAAIAVCVPAFAGDPPAAVKDAVEVKLAVKPGDSFRFRHVESSATDVNGKAYSGVDLVHEYGITVKAVRPDGGADVELKCDVVTGKLASRTGGAPVEFDSRQTASADADPATKVMVSLATALTGGPVTVSLDAHGTVTAVKGLREILMGRIKGTPLESAFSAEKDFSDAKCVDEVAPLFVASPAEPHAVGAAWTAVIEDRINQQPMEFTSKFAISAADVEKVVVAAKLDWKTNPEATANGATATGGGFATATFSKKDGLPLSASKNLKAARDTGAMKANSSTTHTIERLATAAPAQKGK